MMEDKIPEWKDIQEFLFIMGLEIVTKLMYKKRIILP